MIVRINHYRFEGGQTVKVGESNRIGGVFIEGTLDEIFESSEDEDDIKPADNLDGDKIYWYLGDACSCVLDKPFDYDEDGNPVFDEDED